MSSTTEPIDEVRNLLADAHAIVRAEGNKRSPAAGMVRHARMLLELAIAKVSDEAPEPLQTYPKRLFDNNGRRIP